VKERISSKRKRTKRIIILSFIPAILVVLVVSAFCIGLTTRHYDIRTDKLSKGQSVRIVVIADLHSNYYGEEQQDLIAMIKEQKPDIIALVGDIIDDNRAEDGAIDFFEGIQNLAPTYYVLGNHEVWIGETNRIKEMVASYGIKVLTNESDYITINDIELCISGIDDPVTISSFKESCSEALITDSKLLSGFFNLDKDVYNILLAHRPERFESYQNYEFDLVLCGHTHGGQVRIPGILNGVVAPNQGYFPKYAGGRYEENMQTMIVSRGLGVYELVPRVFNPPEVVVIDIVRED
jgi:uncharacterized protein